jgi:hypothetical protein
MNQTIETEEKLEPTFPKRKIGDTVPTVHHPPFPVSLVPSSPPSPPTVLVVHARSFGPFFFLLYFLN